MVAQGVSPGNTDVIQEPLEGRKNALPPLPGALLLDPAFPGLMPGATISRPDGLSFALRKYFKRVRATTERPTFSLDTRRPS